jgi:hypothetical protein
MSDVDDLLSLAGVDQRPLDGRADVVEERDDVVALDDRAGGRCPRP